MINIEDNFKSMSDVIFEDAGKFIRVIFIKNLPTYVKKDITRLLPKYFWNICNNRNRLLLLN
ncbi:MAG: hypothetical protein R2942_04390 [Ignavibacteria bacterium]